MLCGFHDRKVWLTVLKAGCSKMEEIVRGLVLVMDLLSESQSCLCSHYLMEKEENSPDKGFVPAVCPAIPNHPAIPNSLPEAPPLMPSHTGLQFNT